MKDWFKFRTYIPDKKFFKLWGWIKKGEYKEFCATEEYSLDELLEKYTNQCTGLKDKNGKLIYVGDIVTPVYSNASLLEPPVIGQVVSGKSGFEIKSSHIAYSALQILNSEKAFEIIGNIYENPELLESEPTNE